MLKRTQNKRNVVQVVIFLIIVLLGGVYVRYTWERIEGEQSENVLQIARSVEMMLPKADLKALVAKPEDIVKPQYQVLKSILKAIIHVNPKARFAYVYTEQNGKLFFYADSEPVESKDYSPPGQEYTEAASTYYQVFKDGKELITGSATDRWGTWRSVLVPIKDEDSSKTVAVFAMDFNAKLWNNSILLEVFQSSILIVLVLLAFLFLLNIKSKNWLLKEEIAIRVQAQERLLESEEKYRLIFEHTPVGLLSFNENGVIVACNENFAKIIGSSQESLIGLNMLTLPDKQLVSTVQKALDGNTGLYEDVYESVTAKKTSPVRALFTPMDFGGGHIRGGVGIVEDVTERTQMELEISQGKERASQQRNAIARVAEDDVISFGELTASFQRLAEEVADAIKVGRTSIWLLSDDKSVLQCISLFENNTRKHSSGIILKYADYPRYFEAINHESRISAADAQNDPRTSEFTDGYLSPLGISSMLDAGIYIEGELQGVVCLEHTGEKRIWYSDEESFASTIASIVAQTIANGKRKLAETALRISEEKYRTIFENIQDVFYQTDLGGTILEISPSIKHFSGYSRDEIIGTPVDTLYSNPEDKALLLFELTKNSELRDYELMLKTKTGEIKHVSINARLISDTKGKLGHIDGAIRDITERREAEIAMYAKTALLEAQVNSSLDGILVIDENQKRVLINQRIVVLFNIPQHILDDEDDTALLQHVVSLTKYPEQFLDKVMFLYDHINETSIDEIEFKNGMIIDRYSAPVIGKGGQYYGRIWKFRNITERKIAEKEIKLKNQELKNLNAEKDKFFSIIAHDLRNPFNAFLGFTEILVEELPTLSMEELHTIAVNMRKSATNLYSLLENLLEWSLLQRDIASFNPETFVLIKKMTDCMALVLEPATKKGIEIIHDIPMDMKVVADIHMFSAVVRNLISNAIKFTPRGGQISFVAKFKTENQIEFSIKDSGIGMSREMVDNLFRLDIPTNRNGTENEPSTGLGLIICKEFIEKHGGKLWVESEEGKGSTFRFSLPAIPIGFDKK